MPRRERLDDVAPRGAGKLRDPIGRAGQRVDQRVAVPERQRGAAGGILALDVRRPERLRGIGGLDRLRLEQPCVVLRIVFDDRDGLEKKVGAAGRVDGLVRREADHRPGPAVLGPQHIADRAIERAEAHQLALAAGHDLAVGATDAHGVGARGQRQHGRLARLGGIGMERLGRLDVELGRRWRHVLAPALRGHAQPGLDRGLVSAEDALVFALALGGRARILEVVVVERQGRLAVQQPRRSRADAHRMPQQIGLGIDDPDLARAVDDLDAAFHEIGLAREVGEVLPRDRPPGDRGEARIDHDVGIREDEERSRLLRVGDPPVLLAVGHQRPPDELLDRLGEAGRRAAQRIASTSTAAKARIALTRPSARRRGGAAKGPRDRS